jgi:hypothetical protein
MRNLATRLIVGLITCAIGIATSSLWSTPGNSPANGQRCRDGLVILEQQLDAPARLSISETNCPNPYFANVGFNLESKSTRPISRYEVRMITSYDGIVDSYSTMQGSRTAEGKDITSSNDQRMSDFVGVGLKRGFLRAPNAELRLSIWSVTFTDGTMWNRRLRASE